MKRIIDAKSSGKTRKLMQYAQETGAVFVCKNPEKMSQKAISYGIVSLRMYSYSEFHSGLIDPRDKVVIDELEDYLATFIPNNVIGFSLSLD